jgi:hypothetical protein
MIPQAGHSGEVFLRLRGEESAPVWWSIMRLVPALLARSRGTGSRIDVFDDDFNGPWARDSCMLSNGE